MYKWNPFTNNLDEKGDWFFGGNTLGSKKTIGSIDNQDFGIITNNSESVTVLKNGNVGIGTTNPLATLQVKDNSTFVSGTDKSVLTATFPTTPSKNGSVQFGKFGGVNNGAAIVLQQTEGIDRLLFRASALPGAIVWEQPEENAKLYIDIPSRSYIFDSSSIEPQGSKTLGTVGKPWANIYGVNGYFSGNVGIGTTNPTRRLTVVGNSEEIFLMTGPNNNGLMLQDIANPSMASFLGYNGTSYNPIEFRATSGYGSQLYLATSGNIGIGTTAPNQQLEITKNFRLPATSGTTPYGIIYKGGTRFIHDFNYGDNGTVTTQGQNLFIGPNAGNFTMGSTATSAFHSSYNIGIGNLALNNNTTGFHSVAIGYNALYNNTSAFRNLAIGTETLYSNTTGAENVAIGFAALHNNVKGYYNTSIGTNSLYSNTGYQNTAIGYNSGRFIADGVTGKTTGNNGLYLGYNSKASANGTDNEIVIGYNAVGKGSNTAVIGSESLTALYVSGQVIPATLTSDPTGIEGGIYFNTTDKHFYGYDGTTWKQLDN